MATDPRKFLVSRPCAKHENQQIGKSSAAEGFFKTLGKVGDLEVLNKVDSRIGQGLRTLSGISENVRNNSGPVPSIIRKTGTAVLDAGADFVLDTVGVGAVQTRTEGVRFSPQVANRALGQAEAIYESVRQGRFDEFENLPEAISEFSNLEILLRSIFTGASGREDRFKDQCVSPYAMDLIARAPKHQFMFVVEFILNEQYQEMFSLNNLAEELAFVIKRSTRPNISYDYEEVNMYNYRTKVPKRVEYQPMTMSFYDDIGGKAIQFWDLYLRAMSPISDTYVNSGFNSKMLEVNGMGTSNGAAFEFDRYGSAGIGGLAGNATSVLDRINLYHIYNGGALYDRYVFQNPKFTEMQLSELDMSTSGDGSEMTFTFSYDALLIEASYPSSTESQSALSNLTDSGLWPMSPPIYGEPTGSSQENQNRGILQTAASGVTGALSSAGDWVTQGIGGWIGKDSNESENV